MSEKIIYVYKKKHILVYKQLEYGSLLKLKFL